MKRIALLLALVFAIACLAVGCAPSAQPTASGEPADAGASTPASADASAAASAPASSATSSAPQDPNKTTFTVGFDKGFPPMGFVDDSGNLVGFDLDLAAEVAKRLNLEIKLQPIAWDSKTMELDSGNIDCIWNGFTMNGRENDYEWTTAYMNNRQVIVVKGDASYATPEDLKDKSIALQKDSSATAALDANDAFKKSVKPVETDTYLNAFMELESGSVEGVLVDEIVARYNIEKQKKNWKILDKELASEEYGVGFKKGNSALRDKVQKALEDMAADGTTAKISTTWFGSDITTIGKK